MNKRILTLERINGFSDYLYQEEKNTATREKYLRDVRAFCVYAGGKGVSKGLVLAWKRHLVDNRYAVRSINSMLASVNSLLTFLGWSDCKVKNIRLQRQTYCAEEKELTKAEYLRLLEASKKNEQLNLVLQTICGTGIRVSELRYFTVEALRHGEITVNCKSKTRTILVPDKLKSILLNYAKQNGITTGAIFITRNGKPLNRSNIRSAMKKLYETAGVKPSKVFPHNLRKPLCSHFLRNRKGHRQACRHSGTQLHQHYPHLYHDHRRWASPQNRTTRISNIEKPHNSHYVVIRAENLFSSFIGP